ncbi:MAG: hypothetical protein LBV04_03770, partial [Deferribacteraceae bacterium]|nr:hypothetical protein [Deferribacteraceae bacterium]
AALQAILDAHSEAISAVAFVPDTGRVIVLARNGQGSQLIVLSLYDCEEERRFNFEAAIDDILVSPLDSAGVWGLQGGVLTKWSITSGEVVYTQELLLDNVFLGLAQSRDGKFMAAWTASQVFILRFDDPAKPAIAWSGTLDFPVASVALDSRNSQFYIASADGMLEKRNINGAVVNSFDLERPIQSLAMDEERGQLLIGAASELLKLDTRQTAVSRVSLLPAYDVNFSGNMQYLAVIGDKGYTIFSYPELKAIYTDKFAGTKLALMPNGSAVTFSNNVLKFFDQLKRRDAGSAYIFSNAIGFVSPDMHYYGNAQFISNIREGRVDGIPSYVADDRQANKQNACKPFKEMVSSVYMPSVASAAQPTRPSAAAPTSPSTSRPSTAAASPVKPPTSATPPAKPNTPVTTKPTVAQAQQPASVSTPTVNQPTRPQVPAVTRPTPTPSETNIPSWVLNPNALADYSAVKSGQDSSSALADSRIKIRDDVARNVMKTMLSVDMVNQIASEDVKKRFLWQVAAKTAQLAAGYAIQTDMWTSPQGLAYVLAHVDTDTINQIYEPTFREEMDQLTSYGDEAYMSNEPVKWE